MSIRLNRILPLVLIPLAAFCVVKMGYLGLEYYLDNQISSARVDDEIVEAATSVAVSGTDGRRFDHTTIITRNLFGSFDADEGEAETVQPELTQNLRASELEIVLMGTVQGGKETNRAIIMEKTTHKQELYGVGDFIQGAKVNEIQRGKVILAYNGEFEILDMSEAAKLRTSLSPQKPNLPKGLKKRVTRRRVPSSPVAGPPEDLESEGLQRPTRDVVERRLVRPKVIRPSRRIVPQDD